ncbi:MAG: sugar phosphate isomerase/epimerase [Clostridia bacterium]|nr:sugar phosphate isomerase/epimerase [Clostridia bacterium]
MIKSIQIPYNELFETRCRLAHDAGFRHMAVNFAALDHKTSDEWNVMRDDIEKILEKYNLKCVQSHLYYYDLRISSEIIDEEREEDIKEGIRVTAELGGDWCVYHPRTAINSGYKTSSAMEDNKKVISTYLEAAVKYGTGVALENLPIFGGIVPQMPFFTSNYEDLITLTDSFNDKRVGICWDTGHANMMDFNQANAIKEVGSRLKCTHIHNNFKREDSHMTPLAGDIKWDEVMKAFKEISYEGPFTCETGTPYTNEEAMRLYMNFDYQGLEYLEKLN